MLQYLKFPTVYVEGIRESTAIVKMKTSLEDASIFNDGSDEEGRGGDAKSTGGAERRSARQKKKLEQDQVFMTPEVKGDIKQFTKLVKVCNRSFGALFQFFLFINFIRPNGSLDLALITTNSLS